jgi:hypothetical protein
MKRYLIIVAVVAMFIPISTYAQGTIDSAGRLQEIQERRASSVAQEQRQSVVNQCQTVKTLMPQIQTASDAAVKKRLAVYASIQKEVKAIELRMTKQGADASEVDLLIGKLQQNLDIFIEQSRYTQLLSEAIATIDCNTSPETYVSAMQEYKDARQLLYQSAAELKNSVLAAKQQTFDPLIDRLRI